MKDTEYIIGVYNFINLDSGNSLDSAYFILYLLDEKGLLDQTTAHKIYAERFKSDLNLEILNHRESKMLGPFQTIDQLNQFAFLLCEELNAAKVSLLSVQEYNSLLETTQSASSLHRDLLEKGNIIENIERKKKGFLNRFF